MKTFARKHKFLAGIAGRIFVVGVTFAGVLLSTSAQTDRTNTRRETVELDQPEWRQNLSVRALANQSKVIAIGVPVSNVSRRSNDGFQVTTDYQFRVEEVIKGGVKAGSEITVGMPGGLVREADGSLFQVRTRRVRKMQNGKRFVLFLENARPNGNSTLSPVRGSQGIFEIPANGSRVVHLGRSFDQPPADDGEEIGTFLTSLRQIVRGRE